MTPFQLNKRPLTYDSTMNTPTVEMTDMTLPTLPLVAPLYKSDMRKADAQLGGGFLWRTRRKLGTEKNYILSYLPMGVGNDSYQPLLGWIEFNWIAVQPFVELGSSSPYATQPSPVQLGHTTIQFHSHYYDYSDCKHRVFPLRSTHFEPPNNREIAKAKIVEGLGSENEAPAEHRRGESNVRDGTEEKENRKMKKEDSVKEIFRVNAWEEKGFKEKKEDEEKSLGEKDA